MRHIIYFLSLLSLVLPADLAAQTVPSLAPGARMRVTTSKLNRIRQSWDEQIWSGTFVAIKADTLVLRDNRGKAPLGIALANVRRLEVSQGRSGRGEEVGKYMIGGLLTGAVVGAAVTFVAGRDAEGMGYAPFFVAPLAGLGLLIGITIGALHTDERWQRVPLPLGAGVSQQPPGGVRLAASLNF